MAKRLFSLLAVTAFLLVPTPASTVTFGQVDRFETGTTENWVVGDPSAPAVIPPFNAPGGPTGAADHFLHLTAVQLAPSGNRLTVINRTQWTGNYLGAGVDSIAMDVNNLGPTDLSLRLYVADSVSGFGAPPPNAALSSTAVLVPSGSLWTPVVFPVGPADLTAQRGTVQAALLHAGELRIYHNPLPAFPGPPIDAQLGVDNMSAVPGIAPAAEPGPSRTIHVGSVVSLDGSGSADPNGQTPLSFAWSLAGVPAGSTAVLSDPAAVNPTFVADKLGNYDVELAVTNSAATTNPFGRATITAANSLPTANAGRSQRIRRRPSTVRLNGLRSSDPDGDPIGFTWSFVSKPRGSRARLKGARTARPVFVADRRGIYVFKLLVSDPYETSFPSSVEIRVR